MRRLLAALALGVSLFGTASAHATTTQPNGLVIPLDSMNGETQLYTMFSSRGEPVDWLADSNTTPDTFSPLCSFTAEFLLHEAGSSLSVGWYNVDPAATAAPSASEIYNIVPAGSPVGTKITGTTIRTDPKYKGGLIGFALTGGQTHYSERKWNVVCTSCTPAAPWITSVTYQSKKLANSYYLAFEDGNITGSSFGNDGDYNDYVFLFQGLNCPGAGTACDTGKKGLCGNGANTCVDGKLTCKDVFTAGAKKCNGLDNDCDGTIDDGPCPTGTVCTRGACLPACGSGEFKCTGGTVCDKGICVEPPCVGKVCPDGKTCVAGDCVDACTGVICPKGQICTAGACIDLCAALSCGPDEVCDEGLCKAKCDCAGCPTGKACDATSKKCVEPACSGKSCPAGQVCSAGSCVDACTGVVCPKGQACSMGKCNAVIGDAGVDDGGTTTDSGPIDFDGGFGDDDASTGADAGSGAAFDDVGKDQSGCGCTTAGHSTDIYFAFAGLALAAVAIRRRR
ncbi:MAG: MYXO-CTERM sorting domain-containing protein [Polyangiales bacterium]